MRGQIFRFPDGGSPEKRLQTALVFVHPVVAAHGPELKIYAQAALVRSWAGPLFVLQDAGSFPASGPGATLCAALDAAVTLREGAGWGCRIAPRGRLAAVVRLRQLAGPSS